MTEDSRASGPLAKFRILAWALVVLAAVGIGALFVLSSKTPGHAPVVTNSGSTSLGRPFTLVGADGKPFASSALANKPYAVYFGFTRCGDVCPITLGRLVKLRRQAGGDDKLNIVFVTIDPKNDGPKEVGQYAEAFNAPIIGLTGNEAQIDRVKKQFGIFALPAMHPMPGKEMEHTATVLLFNRDGKLAGTIATDETDAAALDKIKRLL
jgi:protein SCO1/2